MTQTSITKKIDEEAEYLALKFSHLGIIAKRTNAKYLLAVFYLQKENQNNLEWIGASNADICQYLGIPPKRELKKIFFGRLDQNWIHIKGDRASTRPKDFFSLTTQAFDLVDDLIQRKSQVFDLYKGPIPLDDIQLIYLKIDALYYVIRAVRETYIHNRIYDDDIDLYYLANRMQLKPYELIDLITGYIHISAESNYPIEKLKNKFLIIKPGKPRYEKFERKCDDSTICNFLCQRCHNTSVKLTPEGEDYGGRLKDKELFVETKTLVRSVDFTTRFIALFTLLASLIVLIFNSSWFYTGIAFYYVMLGPAFLVGWFFSRYLVQKPIYYRLKRRGGS